ncbi:hypothetical protein PFISCL1PPCAC_28899, partial [Pristionchus fissidentatus]
KINHFRMAEAKAARAGCVEAIWKRKAKSTLQESLADIINSATDELDKLDTNNQIDDSSSFNIKYFLNSLEYEAFVEEKGSQLNFEFIRRFVHGKINRQINPRGGDAGQFRDIRICDLEEGATRCLLWNAGSNCLRQLDDLLKLERLIDKIEPDILLLNEITLTERNKDLFVDKMAGLGYNVAVSIAPSYKPGKVRTQRGSAILAKRAG